jgi:hypothetical protein
MLGWWEMRVFILCLVATACSDEGNVPVPNIATPTCGWIAHEEFTAPDDSCARLVPSEGSEVRFLGEHDDSCNGSTCIWLNPGEKAFILGPALGSGADFHIRFTRAVAECDDVPACPPGG